MVHESDTDPISGKDDRCEIKMGGQGLVVLIGLKVLIIMTSLQNSVI